MRKLLLGTALLLVGMSLAPKIAEAAKAARGADASAQQAIVECRHIHSGVLSKSSEEARPMRIENCFHAKIGRYPFELGIPIYPSGYSPWSDTILR